MKKYAVLGNPIAHSKSPQIHQAFAQQFDIELSYERILVPAGELNNTLQNFQANGGSGVNITLPLKEEAWQLVTERTPRAQKAGAVNTIMFKENNFWFGDNTDGVGLLADLIAHHAAIENRQILIVGAGGATRSIIEPLLSQKPHSLLIANRTVERAERLVKNFTEANNIAACGLEQLTGQTFDVIINATAAGIKGEVLSLPVNLRQDAVCYDLVYGDAAKPFLNWAKQQGAAQCLDGLGMLIEQAAEAFYLWHGKRPETKTVRELLRNN